MLEEIPKEFLDNRTFPVMIDKSKQASAVIGVGTSGFAETHYTLHLSESLQLALKGKQEAHDIMAWLLEGEV